jgi:hypothetical protein
MPTPSPSSVLVVLTSPSSEYVVCVRTDSAPVVVSTCP